LSPAAPSTRDARLSGCDASACAGRARGIVRRDDESELRDSPSIPRRSTDARRERRRGGTHRRFVRALDVLRRRVARVDAQDFVVRPRRRHVADDGRRAGARRRECPRPLRSLAVSTSRPFQRVSAHGRAKPRRRLSDRAARGRATARRTRRDVSLLRADARAVRMQRRRARLLLSRAPPRPVRLFSARPRRFEKPAPSSSVSRAGSHHHLPLFPSPRSRRRASGARSWTRANRSA